MSALDDCFLQLDELTNDSGLLDAYQAYQKAFEDCVETRDCTQDRTEHGQILTGAKNDIPVKEARETFDAKCSELKGITCGGSDETLAKSIYNIKDFVSKGDLAMCFPKVCRDDGAGGIKISREQWEKEFGTESMRSNVLTKFKYKATCSDKTFIESDGEQVNGALQNREKKKVEEKSPVDVVSAEQEAGGSGSNFIVITAVAVVLLVVALFILVRKRRSTQNMPPESRESFVHLPESRVDVVGTPPSHDQRTYKKLLSQADTAADVTLTTLTSTGTNKSAGSSGTNQSDITLQAYLDPSQITVHETIGQGSFGAVYLGEYLGSSVAIKFLVRNRFEYKEFASEINILHKLLHPNIVQFLGTSYLESHGVCAILEYMAKGDLCTVLKQASEKQIEVPWKQSGLCKSKIALDIVKGLAYLHGIETPIVHRDLKSRNILLSEQNVAKIADFGVSRTISRTETMTAAGSTLWQAPEVLRGEKFDEKADIYSYGVILTEIDTEKLPYHDKYYDAKDSGSRTKLNAQAVAYRVSMGNFPPTISKACPPEIRQLAMQCLDPIPRKRPSAISVVKVLKLWASRI